MATDAKTIMTALRATIADITGITRVSGDRKTAAPGSGKTSASVLYNGEDLSLFVINASCDRIEHEMPVKVELRSSTADDDVLVDMLYDVLDALLLPANKPTDVITILPESSDEPELAGGLLVSGVNVVVKFRRNRAKVTFTRVTSFGDNRTTSLGDLRIVNI